MVAVDLIFKFHWASYILAGNCTLTAFGAFGVLELGKGENKEKKMSFFCKWAQDNEQLPLNRASGLCSTGLRATGTQLGALSQEVWQVTARVQFPDPRNASVWTCRAPSASTSGSKPHSIKGRPASPPNKQKSRVIWKPFSLFSWYLIYLSFLDALSHGFGGHSSLTVRNRYHIQNE